MPHTLFFFSTQTADYSYRAAVRELVPQLLYLDDLSVEEEGRSCCSIIEEDQAIIKKFIRGCDSPHAANDDGVFMCV